MAKCYWDRLAGVYLVGLRNDLVLSPARTAAEGVSKHWETARDSAFHLHSFTESRDAYRYAATLFDMGNFAGEIRLKAGCPLMKTKDLVYATVFFGLRPKEDRRAVGGEGGPLTLPIRERRMHRQTTLLKRRSFKGTKAPGFNRVLTAGSIASRRWKKRKTITPN